MRVTLDAGGITSLSGDGHTARARRRALLDADLWPPIVPAPTLVESLTGDHRRHHAANRLLRDCDIVAVDELIARQGAQLRTQTGRADDISAVDAIVVAVAAASGTAARVITSDASDIDALIAVTGRPDISSHPA